LDYAVKYKHATILTWLMQNEHLQSIDVREKHESLADALGSSSSALSSIVLNSDSDFLECEDCGARALGAICNAPLSAASVLKRTLRRIPPSLLSKIINCDVNNDKTALYLCSRDGACDKMTLLLNAGADLNDEAGALGEPLIVACSTGRLLAVKLLVQRGAKLWAYQGKTCLSAVFYARHHPPVLRWLLVERFMEHPKLLMSEPGMNASTGDNEGPNQITVMSWEMDWLSNSSTHPYVNGFLSALKSLSSAVRRPGLLLLFIALVFWPIVAPWCAITKKNQQGFIIAARCMSVVYTAIWLCLCVLCYLGMREERRVRQTDRKNSQEEMAKDNREWQRVSPNTIGFLPRVQLTDAEELVVDCIPPELEHPPPRVPRKLFREGKTSRFRRSKQTPVWA
jgi:Ankyrin repeats (3 copies)